MATAQETWERMSDLDKGAALLHIWKRDWEGDGYAVANYPCRYLEAPELVALSPREACRHAVWVCGSYEEIEERLGQDEFIRLYDLALTEDQRRSLAAYHSRMQAHYNNGSEG